jgi:hypothetical protein
LEESDWNLLEAIHRVLPEQTQTLPSERSDLSQHPPGVSTYQTTNTTNMEQKSTGPPPAGTEKKVSWFFISGISWTFGISVFFSRFPVFLPGRYRDFYRDSRDFRFFYRDDTGFFCFYLEL